MTEESKIDQIFEMVRAMKDVMVVKDDLIGFATKDDLKEFATKDDLKGLATKDDIAAIHRVMMTKEDAKVFATKSDLQETESRLMDHIDGLAMRTEKFEHELVAAQAKFNRLEERIEVVELKVGIAV